MTPDDFFISAINPYIVIDDSPDGTKMLIRFGYHLLPVEEILEHQTYPGINTYVVLDVSSGKELGRISDLAFIPYYELISNDGKYLIVAHTQDMTGEDYSTKEEDWKHQASVYSIESGELCFRIEGRDECSTLINSGSKLIGLTCYDEPRGLQDTITEYYIKERYIISKYIDFSEGDCSVLKSTPEYFALKNKNGTLLKYYYDKDWKKSKKQCKRLS